MQTNPAVEQNKNIQWSESPKNQSGRKAKGLWTGGKDLPKSQVLSSKWKTKRVITEDESGDSEDGEDEDDELPCVIGESEAQGWKKTIIFSFRFIRF